jgi:S-layer protein (TIGR01567 family)
MTTKKTLATGEEWELGGGFSLVANQIDLEGDKVWFSLYKDGMELDNEVASTGGLPSERVYTYTEDVASEEDIPIFSCYVDAVFRGTDSNVVQVMYVFLIDNEEILEINVGDEYDNMEVVTVNPSDIVLENHLEIYLLPSTTALIMGNLFFKTTENTSAIE